MELGKITQHGERAEKRRFRDACGLAHGLELAGERWALLVMRELLLGPRRFSDLRADLPGISANILSQRLTELEARQIVERVVLPAPARVPAYGLTPFGLAAEPMILAMARWAMSSPAHDRSLPVNRVSMLLSLKTTIDMSRVGFLTMRIGFRFGDAAYRARLDRTGLVIEAGEDPWPDLLYTASPRRWPSASTARRRWPISRHVACWRCAARRRRKRASPACSTCRRNSRPGPRRISKYGLDSRRMSPHIGHGNKGGPAA